MDELLRHRWSARDRELDDAILAVQAEMNRRGILISSIAVKETHDVFRKEFEASRAVIVQTIIDSLRSKKVKLDRRELDAWAVASLADRRDFLDGLFMQRAKVCTGELQNQTMMAPFMDVAQYFDHASKEISIELNRAIDVYEKEFGATLTDRIINSFKNRPVVAIGVVIVVVISAILGLVAALRGAGS